MGLGHCVQFSILFCLLTVSTSLSRAWLRPTSTLQPPAQGPDHFGTPEPLEAGSQVPVVPLQRAHLHNPGQVAGVTEPALLLRVGVATVLAGEEVTVQALPLGGHEEPVGLQAAGAVGLIQVGRIREQLPLGALFLNPVLQSPQPFLFFPSQIKVPLNHFPDVLGLVVRELGKIQFFPHLCL